MAKRAKTEESQTLQDALADQQPEQRQPGDEPPERKSKLEIAQAKFDRMKETNKIAFRFQTDFGKIEDELRKFKYSDYELAHILEPKGTKMVPGYTFTELRQQEQYVNFLTAQEKKRNGSHAEGVEKSRDQGQEPGRF